jgi:hypothetical protein
MFKKCGLLNSKLGVKRCMSKVFHGLLTTVKKGVTNIPNDFRWYTTMTKVAISIVSESQDLKPFTIRQKFVNKSLYFVRFVKKSLQF